MGETSYIPKVLQKESEIEAMLDSAKEESQGIIDSAKHEAQRYVREFKEKLPNIVRKHYETEIQRARDEAQHIKDMEQVQAEDLKKRAMKRLDSAVEEIVQAILPAPLADEEESV